jgi:hypothetical protein
LGRGWFGRWVCGVVKEFGFFFFNLIILSSVTEVLGGTK